MLNNYIGPTLCTADVQRLSHKLEIEPELLKKYFRINIKAMCGGGLVSNQPTTGLRAN